MPVYSYTARDRHGEKTGGRLEAAGRPAALSALQRQGLVPIELKEGAVAADGRSGSAERKRLFSGFGFNRAPRMSSRENLLFSRELADLLSSGMKLGHALHTLALRKTGRGRDELVTSLRDDVMQGAALSEAMSRYPKTFSTLYISMIRAGEAAGALPETLEALCTHFERVHGAREKVAMALVYPGIVLSLGILTLLGLVIFIIPRFSAVFEELGGTLPLMTRMLIGGSRFLLDYGWAVVLVLGVLVWLARRWLRTPNGILWWDRSQLRWPVLKGITASNAYANFARTLETLVRNGVPILQALSIVEQTVGNAVIAREIHAARERVTDGSSIAAPLAAGGVFPVALTDMLAIGEQSGDLAGALRHIGRRYERRLEHAIALLTTILEPVLILFVAIMVGFVAISMLTAVFDLTSGLQM
ncbi:type II secretion system F family protein [Kiritimatiella glycovorans]|uniref:General secretion pathway protein F n=1 Tax=Kiritimatiella glycovorans TaxID=1307763 RepID=A0A0G3EIM4_9BACT|nr:type II secretion system F family protein [Kiritimatiella glycovorans]AKJ63994.1 General secretion pathway protein F [Kiritimatiella glycovorans]